MKKLIFILCVLAGVAQAQYVPPSSAPTTSLSPSFTIPTGTSAAVLSSTGANTLLINGSGIAGLAGQGYLGVFSSNANQYLYEGYAPDGISFSNYCPTYTAPTGIIANPSICKSGTQFLLMHYAGTTPIASFSYFSIAASPEAVSWKWWQNVDCSSVSGTSNPAVWAPHPEASGSNIYTYFTYGVAGSGTAIAYTLSTNFGSTWGAPVKVTGLAANVLDARVHVLPSGSFGMLVRDITDGDFIYGYSAPSGTGPWTAGFGAGSGTGNWLGFGGGHCEAPDWAFRADGSLIVWADDFSDVTNSVLAGYVYTTSTNNGSTFASYKNINSQVQLRHGGIIASPSQQDLLNYLTATTMNNSFGGQEHIGAVNPFTYSTAFGAASAVIGPVTGTNGVGYSTLLFQTYGTLAAGILSPHDLYITQSTSGNDFLFLNGTTYDVNVQNGNLAIATAGKGFKLSNGDSFTSTGLVATGTNSLLNNQTLTGTGSIITRGLGDARYLAASGTNSFIKTGTGSAVINFGTITVGVTASGTIPITGAAVPDRDTCLVGLPSNTPAGIAYSFIIISSTSVRVNAMGIATSVADPSGTFSAVTGY